MRLGKFAIIILTVIFATMLLLSGYSITVAAAPVELPSPAYHLALNEGTGLNVYDSITGAELYGIDTSLNWCRDDINNYMDKSFVKTGANFGNKGVIEGNLITAALDQYTFTFLTRITDIGAGSILNTSSGLHFRFWYGKWDIAGGVSGNPAYTKYNTWVRVTYVQDASQQYIYVNEDLTGQLEHSNPLPAGSVRIGAYTSTGFPYPGEYTDIQIFAAALTAEQIGQLCDDDGTETEFVRYADGSDLGGIWKREEHSGQYNTVVSVENGTYKHWFNGDTCWGAAAMLIPPGHDSLWFSADFLYPSTLTANHDFGFTAQTIATYNDTGRGNPIAILLLDHDETTNILTLGRIRYRNTTDGTTTVDLDGRKIDKDIFHKFELNYNRGETGSLAFYLNGEELLNVSSNFDLEVEQVMFGLNLGIHPEPPGDHIFSDKLYVGEYRLEELCNFLQGIFLGGKK